MQSGQKGLYALLDERNAATDDLGRAQVDQRIWERFGARRSVIIGDMSGFSRITRAHGILHFLAVIRDMHRLLSPIVERYGQVTKMEADNLYASFADPTAALRAAVGMHHACTAHNEGRPEHFQILMSFGIGFGDILDLEGEDYFGDEVNVASKLGEDIGSGGQTLLTAGAAHSAELPGGHFLEQHSVRISGLNLPYYSLETLR